MNARSHLNATVTGDAGDVQAIVKIEISSRGARALKSEKVHINWRFFGLLAAFLLAFAFAHPLQGAERHYQEAAILQSAEYNWCNHDCVPFDRSTYFFCFQAPNEILIGSRKADWTWMPDSVGMLEKSKQVSLRYDEKSIWVIRADGKETHLNRDYSEDLFSNPQCTAVVHSHWLQQLASIVRPAGVPQDAVVVPKGPRPAIPLIYQRGPFFWVACKLNVEKEWDVCTSWDEKGAPLARVECIDSVTRTAVFDRDLAVDPLTTKVYYEIHLRNGVILKDWAKGRVNNTPTPNSQPLKHLPPTN